MIKKLRGNSGETLIEAMVALLIAVLAMGLVSSAAITAAKINKSTRAADAEFAKELEAVEIHSAEANTEIKKLVIDFIDFTDQEVDVNVYSKGSNFASY